MEWLDDSKACLDVAQTMIIELEELIQESLKNEDVVPYMKVKIKNCLENCRSPLDYAANYLFKTYCKPEYSDRELKKKKIYFPIRNQEALFDICIREDFRKLPQKRPDIVEILKNAQSFKGDPWLQNLTKLINENKHRNLTKQATRQSGHIEYMEDVMGNTLIGNTFHNVGTAIMINGQPLDPTKPNPYIKQFIGNIESYYVFSDINQNVLNTLNEIYTGAETVIWDLEKL